MDKIKIVIVDDEKLIREGLKIILSTYKDIEVMALCENGREAFLYCRENDVDVVLMDVRMKECDGVLGTKLIKEYKKSIKVLMLTTFKDGEYIKEALENGASGYLLKDSSYELIYAGIRAVYEGNMVVHPEIMDEIMSSDLKLNINTKPQDIKNKTGLSERELDIIKKIAEGLSNKEIGKKLFLTEGTVKNNITTILSKLSLRDRTQIAIFAFKNNLVE